jgi:hypothetical protein
LTILAIALAALLAWALLHIALTTEEDELVIAGAALTGSHQVAFSIHVLEHAVDQAQARYPGDDITGAAIAADVANALEEGRNGNQLTERGRSLRGAKDGSQLAWTRAGERIYVWKPDGPHRLIVITALPPVETAPVETAVARALRRAMVA